jgi:hypothetical protein
LYDEREEEDNSEAETDKLCLDCMMRKDMSISKREELATTDVT